VRGAGIESGTRHHGGDEGEQGDHSGHEGH
jgi:hypothetical protein